MPGHDSGEDDDDPLLNTQQIIEEARRPVLIARHQKVVEEMEASIAEGFIDGSSKHPRLQAMLSELDAESEQQRLAGTLAEITTSHHYEHASLRKAIIEHLCLMREQHNVDVAALQIHLIGVYRRLRQGIKDHQSFTPGLQDLRAMPAWHVGRVLNPKPFTFGSERLAESLIIPEGDADRYLAIARKILRPRNADDTWCDALREPSIPREVEQPLLALPTEQREQAHRELVADRIRSRFYRAVFLGYFSPEILSPEEIAAHDTLLHWMSSIEATPHLYPFMQGQTARQKLWRLSCLFRKILQINEIYQRVERARNHPSYRQLMAAMNIRDSLKLLAQEHYPAIRVDNAFILATLFCPFRVLAAWVQEKHACGDFILPPDPR